ncbi:MAG: flagellar motor protein MotA [Rhizobiales bacterium]|nr:flagellar motor protein MotA [Hyphomicrobiales bacterium]
MALESDNEILDRPQVYLLRMMVFTILVAIVAAVLFPQIKLAFMANPGLNGLIVFVLLMGIIYAFRMVWRLFPEVNWVNSFRIADPSLELPYTPRLLAPMATLLRDRHGSTMLSPLTMRSLLDSLASRLDESRDISRYLIGLLIFLGLLGTFWGLLDTVNSVGQVIRQLDVATAESNTIFEELKSGLEAPLSGMGTSFSSSLFGLAGSLVLGFLDLQASQSQNRFYNDLEDWLSTITDIAAGGAGASQLGVPQYLRMDMSEIQEGIDKVNATLEDALSDAGPSGTGEEGEAENMGKLAEAVGGLVHQMREEQKIMRQWAQEQSDQTADISKTLGELSGKPGTSKSRSTSKSEKEKS